MNEITTSTVQLPDTLEDLTQFVLVGKAKLQAYMLKLQTINKLSVAQEIRDQTLKESQEVATALIAAEQRIGELLLAIPKQNVNQYTSANCTHVQKAKSEVVSEMGYTQHEVSDYQRMAQNPDAVQKAVDDAIARGDVVTKSQVMQEIRKAKEEASKRTESAHRQELDRKDKEYIRVCNERNALQDRVKELEGATKEGLDHENLSQNIYYFCMTCNNFIGNVGGLVWLTDRIQDMPEKEKEMFIKAACSFRDWSLAFTQNLNRGMNNE